MSNQQVAVAKIRLAFLGISAGIILGMLPNGQSVQAESLAKALAAAYLNNPSLLAARAGVRATDEGVPRATRFPM